MPKKLFTPEHDAAIIARYADTDTAILAAEFGMTMYQVNCRAGRLGVKKNNAARRHVGSGVPNKPVGTLFKDCFGYWRIKVASGTKGWEFAHKKLWVDTHGPVPEGMHVAFVDGNKDNVTIENLYLITPHDKMLNARTGNLPPELQESWQALQALKREIRKKHD